MFHFTQHCGTFHHIKESRVSVFSTTPHTGSHFDALFNCLHSRRTLSVTVSVKSACGLSLRQGLSV